MTTVRAEECYSFEAMIHKFNRKVEKSGVVGESGRRARYQKPSDVKRLAQRRQAGKARAKQEKVWAAMDRQDIQQKEGLHTPS